MRRRFLLLLFLFAVCSSAQAAVGLHAGAESFEIGSGSFLHAFFSTISANLEPKGWGSRFPVLMKALYRGNVDATNLVTLEKELKLAQSELKKLPPSRVVWDIENRNARPPWGEKISPNITDLSNYFVTSDGKDVFGVAFRAIDSARQQKVPLRIQ